MIAEPHNLRHFLLQISPVERQLCFLILHQAALCVVNRIAVEDEKLLDAPVVYVGGKLRNVDRACVLRNLSDDQRLSDIF